MSIYSSTAIYDKRVRELEVAVWLLAHLLAHERRKIEKRNLIRRDAAKDLLYRLNTSKAFREWE